MSKTQLLKKSNFSFRNELMSIEGWVAFANRYFMLTRIKQFVKSYKNDIILIIIVILISLLSFGTGFLVAKEQQKQPLQFEDNYNEKSSSPYSFIS